MLESLESATHQCSTISLTRNNAYCDKELVSKETIPRVVRMVCEAGVEKDWPLVASYMHFATLQLLLDSANREI
jgi:hypothetical protein